MKGQYTGEDGRTYRWADDGGGGYRIEIQDWTASSTTGVQGSALPGAVECWVTYGSIAPADIDAAFAALRELQEEGEWVYDDPEENTGTKWRLKRDGSQPQWRDYENDAWTNGYNNAVCARWYRAGRTTGLEDGHKEAQELAEAVLALKGRWDEMTAMEWKHLCSLACKVKGE
jgi:hypothetical protein